MKQLTKYGHVASLKPQHCPYLPNPIKYGKDNKAPSPLDDSPLLDEAGKKRVQQIVRSFILYTGSGSYYINGTIWDIITTKCPDRKHNEKGQPISWLHVDTSRCNHPVPCIWHDSQCSLWRVLNAQEAKYFDLSLPNSDIHNHLHQFTSTTQPQSLSQTTPSNANDQDQWKCGISGY